MQEYSVFYLCYEVELKTITMKKNHLVISLCLVGSMLMGACEKEKQSKELDIETADLWWDANTLATLELQGAVRTIQQYVDEENYVFMEFDMGGNIIRSSEKLGVSEQQTTYQYNDKNQLILEEGNDQRIQYEYNSSEKFVPQDPRNWVDSRLIQSLAKISCSLGESWIFEDRGEFLLAITDNDTIEIQYDGNLPIACEFVVGENKYYIGPVTYYKNGMFKEYVAGREWNGKRIPTTVNSYIANNDWMMVQNSKIEEMDFVYTYNQNHHVKTMNSKGEESIVSCYEYEYDVNGNWLKSKMSMQYGNYPEIVTETTRTITYY